MDRKISRSRALSRLSSILTVYVVYPCVAKKEQRQANKQNKKLEDIIPKANEQKQGQQQQKICKNIRRASTGKEND
jgi:hypothetical protein